jgi:hypothetical protein
MGQGALRRSLRGSAALAAIVAAWLVLVGVAGRSPVFAATTTLSPAEESALPTVNPSDIIPGVILVQFSQPVSAAELATFEKRFNLGYISDLAIPGAQPYYELQILDGANPLDKRAQILAGEPLVSWCGPNIKAHLAAGRSASNQVSADSLNPSPAASHSAVGPLASLTAASSAKPGMPADGDPGSSVSLATISLLALFGALVCICSTVLVRRRRRAP